MKPIIHFKLPIRDGVIDLQRSIVDDFTKILHEKLDKEYLVLITPFDLTEIIGNMEN
jgi:hypothetical protein